MNRLLAPIAIGLMFIGFGIYDFITSPVYSKNALTLDGTIVSVETTRAAGKSGVYLKNYTPVVEYSIGDTHFRNRAGSVPLIKPSSGKKVEIKVNRLKPDEPEIKSFYTYALPWLLILFGVVSIILALRYAGILTANRP